MTDRVATKISEQCFMSMLLKGNLAENSLRILRWEIISVDPIDRINVNCKISFKRDAGR